MISLKRFMSPVAAFSFIAIFIASPVSFESVAGSASGPQPLASDYFVGSFVSAALAPPVSPVVFQRIRSNVEFKAMFPGGQTIIPTYEMGIPAGADKSLMEPQKGAALFYFKSKGF